MISHTPSYTIIREPSVGRAEGIVEGLDPRSAVSLFVNGIRAKTTVAKTPKDHIPLAVLGGLPIVSISRSGEYAILAIDDPLFSLLKYIVSLYSACDRGLKSGR